MNVHKKAQKEKKKSLQQPLVPLVLKKINCKNGLN
jgi:hypothetical protein